MTLFIIDSIIENFPNSSLPKFEGESTYKIIKELEHLLIENELSIQSTLGGGNHEYLGLILSLIKYLTITCHNYAGHANPGILSTFPANTM